MLLIRIREKFPLRIAEWLAGLVMISIGLHLTLWPETLTRAGLEGFMTIAPVKIWAFVSLTLGLSRVFALILNGHNPAISAPVRAGGAILGVGYFAAIAAGYLPLAASHGPPLALNFALVLVLGDMFNTGRAALDCLRCLEENWVRVPSPTPRDN